MEQKGKTANDGEVAIIVGSENDLEEVKKSGIIGVLDEVGIRYDVSVISAHRNPEELRGYCLKAREKNHRVIFICAAGMSAALPGIVASYSREHPVIGVALVSDVLDGMDALLAMTRMPRGVPVLTAGIGKSGLYNAAICACQIIARHDSTVYESLRRFLGSNEKPAKIGIMSSK